jgi:hypothetical protein
MDTRMLSILVGALLILGGVVWMASHAIWTGRFRRESRAFTAAGFGLGSNWPGLAMVAVGALLMLVFAGFF